MSTAEELGPAGDVARSTKDNAQEQQEHTQTHANQHMLSPAQLPTTAWINSDHADEAMC